MRLLAKFFPEFAELLDKTDELYQQKRLIDEKTFKGALDAGATVQELAYILALVMREASGADDCWTHDVLEDWDEIVAGNIACGCPA